MAGPPLAAHQLCHSLAQRTAAALGHRDPDSGLETILALALESGLCDEASVTRRDTDGTLRSAAPTSNLVLGADQLQYLLQEGPGVSASVEPGLVDSPNVALDPRWFRWGPAVADLGLVGAISAHLAEGSRATGALNLYSRRPRTWSPTERELIRLIAAHVSIAVAHFRGAENLWLAIESRHDIGVAQGILMQQYGIPAETAFELLRRISQDSNIKLRDVAEQFVRTQKLPEPAKPLRRQDESSRR